MRRALPFLLLLASCSDGPEGGTLNVHTVGDGQLSARLVSDATEGRLIGRDAAGEPVPQLATSWRFLDGGESLILRLAPERWPDGKELQSADVVASIRARRRDPAVIAAGLDARRATRAPITRVVELNTSRPGPLLLEWLAEPAFTVRRRSSAFPGPYRIEPGETAGAPITLVRRAADPAPAARPSRITLAQHESPDAAIAAWRAGTADVVLGEGLAGLDAARAAARGQALRIEPVWGVIGLAINARSGPLANPDLRRALAMAVDRPALADALAKGLQGGAIGAMDRLAPLQNPAPATDWRSRTAAENRAEAVAIFTAAGIGPATPITLHLLAPPGPEHGRIAEQLALMWEPLGVALDIANPPAPERARRLERGTYDLATLELAPAVPDAAALLSRWQCPRSRACVAAADVLLDSALRGADPAAQAAGLAAAEAAWMAAPPFIPLTTPLRWSLVAPQMDGFAANAIGLHPLGRLERRRR